MIRLLARPGVFGMAGGSEEHNLVAAKVVRELGNQIKGSPCQSPPRQPITEAANNRGDKFRHYRNLEKLWAYLLLSQTRVQAELFLRQPDGTWSLSSYKVQRNPYRWT